MRSIVHIFDQWDAIIILVTRCRQRHHRRHRRCRSLAPSLVALVAFVAFVALVALVAFAATHRRCRRCGAPPLFPSQHLAIKFERGTSTAETNNRINADIKDLTSWLSTILCEDEDSAG